MFVGGSTLLVRTYHPKEAAKAQALSEFTTFGSAALAALFAGQWLFYFGWQKIHWAVLMLLLCVTLLTLGYQRRIKL